MSKKNEVKIDAEKILNTDFHWIGRPLVMDQEKAFPRHGVISGGRFGPDPYDCLPANQPPVEYEQAKKMIEQAGKVTREIIKLVEHYAHYVGDEVFAELKAPIEVKAEIKAETKDEEE